MNAVEPNATALPRHQQSVRSGIELLANGFLTDEGNPELRKSIRTGQLRASEYYQQLIVIAYRVLLLLIAEDRDESSPIRIRAMARLISRSPEHTSPDLHQTHRIWQSVCRAAEHLADPPTRSAHPFLASATYVWSNESTPDLLGSSNTRSQSTVRICDRLMLDLISAFTHQNYEETPAAASLAEIGIVELSQTYESLLNLTPAIDSESGRFALTSTGNNARKRTGSFYTPNQLVQHVLDMALEPTIDDQLIHSKNHQTAANEQQADEEALLSIRVCDPSVGAGHVLIAAGRRLAQRLAHIRSGHRHPTKDELQQAFKEVAQSCLYGVDLNPVAADLCRLGIQLETGGGGLPAGILKSRIRVGNALIGAPIHPRLTGKAHAPATQHSTDSHLEADAWCANLMRDNPPPLTPTATTGADQCARRTPFRSFFHWLIEFPEIYPTAADSSSSSNVNRDGFDVVIGNPPFLNQLESSTAMPRAYANIIRARTGGAVGGYADTSAAFMMLAIEIARPGGRVALVQPQSLLAAKDARPVRQALLTHGSIDSLWISNEHVFNSAAVYTCVPTIHVGGPRCTRVRRFATSKFSSLASIDVDNDELANQETWAPLAAAASGIPELSVRSGTSVGDVAHATADFRDQYYGLEGFLIEDAQTHSANELRASEYPPIVTTGLIDPAACHWGQRQARILKRQWTAPRVDRGRMAHEGNLGSWIDSRLRPKLLLATQTKVLEVFADTDGQYLPSIPLISIFPNQPSELWHLAAAIASPVCSAIAMQRYAGTALSIDAIKLSAKQVTKLPLPSDSDTWSRGAAQFEQAQQTRNPHDRALQLQAFGRTMCHAYQIGTPQCESLLDWWIARLERTRSVQKPNKSKA